MRIKIIGTLIYREVPYLKGDKSIGINQYANGIATLNNAVRDAQAFEKILKDKYGVTNSITLYDEDS